MSGAKLALGALATVAAVGVGIALISGGGSAPELSLEAVPSETRDATLDLRGKARGPEGIALNFGDQALRLGKPDDDGWRKFETRALLAEGEHTFTFTLLNGETQLKQKSVTVTRIVETLGIEVESPTEGQILSDANVKIKGRIVGDVDLARSRLLLNGGRVEVKPDKTFELTHAVRPGKQALEFRLQGQHSAELVRNVHYDSTPPWVEIYRPLDKFTLRPKLKVVFRAWDEAPNLKLRLGKLEAEVKTSELWSGEVEVPEGESELKLTVTDPAGNTYERVLEVVRVAPEPIESKAFPAAFKNEASSSSRTRMIRSLDPDDKAMRLTLIARCLNGLDWNHSLSAVLAVSTWSDQETLRSLPGKNAPVVKKNPKVYGPLVERLLLALGYAADPANVPVLTEFVSSEHWHLRRGAAAALERVPDVRALKPLAAAFVKEEHPLVKAAFQRALERISRHYEPTPEAWLKWATDSATLGDPRAPTNFPQLTNQRMLAKGIEWHVTARGPKPTQDSKLPLIVLPEMGYDVSTIEPYLRAIEEHRRVIYLQVPFPREERFGKSHASYPIPKVAASLADLAKQLEQRGELPPTQVALLGIGHGGWIAAQYANLDPVRVTRQLLVNTSPSAQDWFYAVRAQRESFRASRDMDLMVVGSRLSEPGGKPPVEFNQGGLNAICKLFSIQFANPQDPEIAHVVGPIVSKDLEGTPHRVFRGWRPLVGYKWQKFDLIKIAEDTQTMLLFGTNDPFFDDNTREKLARELEAPDGPNVKKTLPWTVQVLANSARFPWVEQPEEFVSTVQMFLD